MAADLNADDLPQRALAVIEAVRADSENNALCVAEAEQANNAAAAAATQIAQARERAAAATDDELSEAQQLAQWRSAKRHLTSALDFDAEAPGADDLGDQIKAGLARDDSLRPLSEAAAHEDAWSTFVDDVLKPLKTLGLAGLLAVAAMLLLARILVAVGLAPLSRNPAPRAWLGCGLLLALVVASAPWWLSADDVLLDLACAAWFFAGVMVWALVLASRLRLRVTYRDDKGEEAEASVTRFVTALQALAGDAPQSVEVPRGTDVSILDDKTVTEIAGGWATSVVAIVRSILGVNPWQLVVDTSSEATSAVLTRNGRTVGAVRVEPTVAGSETSKVEPTSMVAAFVVTSISEAYDKGFEGLMGATRWRSLGWQFEASVKPQPDRRPLLLAAVEDDPDNLLAQIALQRDLYRDSDKDDELAAYAAWTDQTATTLQSLSPGLAPSMVPTLVRLRYSATVTTLNRAAIAAGAERVALEDDAKRLARLLYTLARDDRSAFMERSRRHVGLVILFALGIRQVANDQVRVADAEAWQESTFPSPTSNFNEACRYAYRREDPQAAARLKAIPVTDTWRTNVLGDAMLARLATSANEDARAAYDAFRASPAGGLTSIDPFATLKEKLERSGLSNERAIAAFRYDPASLAVLLGVETQLARRLVSLAQLAIDWQPALQGYRYEAASYLWSKGISSVSDANDFVPRDKLTEGWTTYLKEKHFKETSVALPLVAAT